MNCTLLTLFLLTTPALAQPTIPALIPAPQPGELPTYGEGYTQDDIREIVREHS